MAVESFCWKIEKVLPGKEGTEENKHSSLQQIRKFNILIMESTHVSLQVLHESLPKK